MFKPTIRIQQRLISRKQRIKNVSQYRTAAELIKPQTQKKSSFYLRPSEDHPPMVIILRLLLCSFGSLSWSNVFIPARIAFFLWILAAISGSMDSPLRKGVRMSVSLLENRQFFNLPLAVSRIRLHPSQNGLLTELIIPKLPS